MDVRSLLLFSALLRVLLIIYGEWQDAHMEVRYTDVDYLVFSDAASLVASGKSPYQRSTYRYSPLLAFLLVPNSIIHPSWGKFLFSASGRGLKTLIYEVFFDWLIYWRIGFCGNQIMLSQCFTSLICTVKTQICGVLRGLCIDSLLTNYVVLHTMDMQLTLIG